MSFSNFSKKTILASTLLFFFQNFAVRVSPSRLHQRPEKGNCRIPGMSGTQPDEVCWIAYNAFLRKSGVCMGVKTRPGAQRYILFGPRGNGKTMMVKQLAKLMGAKFLAFSAASMVNRFQGSGAQAVKEIFHGKASNDGKIIKKGVLHIAGERQDVVLFIDEADCILSKNISENQHDTHKASVEFWTQIITLEGNPHIHIFLATNHVEDFHENVLNRYEQSSLIGFQNPGLSNRKEVLQDCYIDYYLPVLFNGDLCAIIMELEADEELYQICRENLKIALLRLEKIDKLLQEMFMSSADKEAVELDIERLKGDIKGIRQEVITCLNIIKGEVHGKSLERVDALALEFFTIADGYLNALDQFLKSDKIVLSKKVKKWISHIAEGAEGFPTRSLVYLIGAICKNADRYNNGQISKEIISEELEKAKKKLSAENGKWTDADRRKLETLKSRMDVIASLIRVECPNSDPWCINEIKKKQSYDIIKNDLEELNSKHAYV